MDDKLHDEFGRIMDGQGAFAALRQMKAKIGGEHDELYKLAGDYILRMTAEARGELKKLDAVLTRIEMAGRQVKSGRPADEALMRELAPFGGWAASLLETYVSYARFTRGSLADQKINELGTALHEMRARQDAGNSRFAKFADVWRAFARH